MPGEQEMELSAVTAELERFTQLFAQAPTFMALLSGPRHVITHTNPGYRRLVGNRDLEGKTIAEALPDAAAQGYLKLLDDVFASNRPYSGRGLKYDVQTSPGQPVDERYVDFVYQPIVDAQGQVSGIFVEGVDVTERTLAEQRREALARLTDEIRDLEAAADISFAAARILGETLGVSRAGYGTIDRAEETITIERDWNAEGIVSLAGMLRFRDYGSYIENLKLGQTVAVADAYLDPRTAAGADALKGISAQAFVNMPTRQSINFRIPRSSTIPTTPPTTKTVTQGAMEDAIGYFVDGVAMFDPTDGFSYANGAEASPGTGQWHRDAYVNEGITFDPGNTHQQNTGKYHNHANPLALRYLLGDHVDFNEATKTYSESAAAPDKHSPILAWLRDGYPLYGPYGYSDPLDPNSGIRRMVAGFVKRDGTTTGVDNITTTGRTLPAWTTRNNGNISATGPAVSTTYPLGRYVEDWAYLGDLFKAGSTKYQQGTDFDLNEYNVRWCVTPEFPLGTYAYFLNVSATGAPQYPYNTNRWFFGTPSGGTSTAAEAVTSYFSGGPNHVETAAMDSTNPETGDISFIWSSVEGGTYQVEAASDDLTTWEILSPNTPAATNAVTTTYVENDAMTEHGNRFYRVIRTALATYDGGGTVTPPAGNEGISTVTPATGTRGTTATLTVTLNSAFAQAPPPNNVQPTSATLTRTGATTINATSYTRNTTTGIVTLVFNLPAGATTGAYTVNATFGPNTWSLTNGFTVN